MVLEPVAPAEETPGEPDTPEETEETELPEPDGNEPAEPKPPSDPEPPEEPDEPETPGIVTLPAQGLVVVIPAANPELGTDTTEPETPEPDPTEPTESGEVPDEPNTDPEPDTPTDPDEPDEPADADADQSDIPAEPAVEPAEPGIAPLPAKDTGTAVVVPTAAADDTVSVDIAWGAMEFTYTAAWNTSTLAYDPGSWSASGNTVTVTNTGSTAANVVFACSCTALGVAAAFDTSGGLLAAGSSTTATLTLSGVWTPDKWNTPVTVGSATVTVNAVQNTAPSETTGTEETDTP